MKLPDTDSMTVTIDKREYLLNAVLFSFRVEESWKLLLVVFYIRMLVLGILLDELNIMIQSYGTFSEICIGVCLNLKTSKC